MIQTRPRKGIETFQFASIPVIKYRAGLQPDTRGRVANTSHHTLHCTRPPRGVPPNHICPKVTALATLEEKDEDTAFTEPNFSLPDNKLHSDTYSTQHRYNSISDPEPMGCSICTDDFRERENVRILPCSHIYHRRCIDPWLLEFARTCPMWSVNFK